ncbi:MAG TPA: hypothetical protein VJH68_00955 [Candidatus Nanoarchaeia archaeon]|nr:hypothetical protein [Candidatus Nanoarchaeia archaeon]
MALSELEQRLFTGLNEVSQQALKEGWALTKQAFGAADPSEQDRLTQEAEAAYKLPQDFVEDAYRSGQFSDKLALSVEFGKALDLEAVRVDINVFDLYRRVGRLEEARELGELTLKAALELDELALVQRAGNFLTLVQAAEAYQLIDQGKLPEALAKYREREVTFKQIGLERAEGKNAVMLYLNQAANHLDIVDLSVEMGMPVAGLDKELAAAADSVGKAQPLIAGLEPQDRANWQANAHYDRGKIDFYRGDFDSAIGEYTQALETSRQGADYNLQAAFIELSLAHAFGHAARARSQVNPDSSSASFSHTLSSGDVNAARLHLQPVEVYMQKNGFGIYQRRADILLKEVKSLLPQ